MPTPWNKGALNANKLGAYFDQDKVVIGTATINASDTDVTVSHSLGSAPEFILISPGFAETPGADRVVFVKAVTSTTIQFAQADTDGATQSIAYLAALLS